MGLSKVKNWGSMGIIFFLTLAVNCCEWQIVEECYPVNALSPEEELDVAFSSFPDSMSQASTRASVHDCVFFFRIRRRGISPVCDNHTVEVRRTVSHPLSTRNDDGKCLDGSGEQHF